MKKKFIKEIITDFHGKVLLSIKKCQLSVPLDSGKTITLTGVRRCGKTYILFDCIKKLQKKKVNKENTLYINFEDERLDLKQEEFDLILQ